MANLYFLLVGVLMMIGESTTLFNSPYSSATTLGPLLVLITISLVNEGLTDLQRHRADSAVNATPADVVNRSAASTLRVIRSGDVVCCRRGETAPVDFVILAGAGEASTAYVDTASIDGETTGTK